MAKCLLELTYPDAESGDLNQVAASRLEAVAQFRKKLEGVAAGRYVSGALKYSYNETSGVQAHEHCTLSSGTGTIRTTINGVNIDITWATSDAVSGGLVSAAINASTNALVKGIVTATDDGAGVVTITAVNKSKDGNCITLAASGTGYTAGAARLSGGVTPVYVTYY